jgi:hypothetical protein
VIQQSVGRIFALPIVQALLKVQQGLYAAYAVLTIDFDRLAILYQLIGACRPRGFV